MENTRLSHVEQQLAMANWIGETYSAMMHNRGIPDLPKGMPAAEASISAKVTWIGKQELHTVELIKGGASSVFVCSKSVYELLSSHLGKTIPWPAKSALFCASVDRDRGISKMKLDGSLRRETSISLKGVVLQAGMVLDREGKQMIAPVRSMLCASVRASLVFDAAADALSKFKTRHPNATFTVDDFNVVAFASRGTIRHLRQATPDFNIKVALFRAYVEHIKSIGRMIQQQKDGVLLLVGGRNLVGRVKDTRRLDARIQRVKEALKAIEQIVIELSPEEGQTERALLE